MKRLLLSCSALICAQVAVAEAAQAQAVSAHTIAQDVMSPSPETQQQFFQAIDAGDVQRVRSHVNFARAFAPISPQGTNGLPNLEFMDAQGNTPLIRAAAAGRVDIVDVLVKNGANINAQNARWETALITSYNAGHYDVAKYLLASGAADPYNVSYYLQVIDAQTQQAALEKAAVAESADKTATIVGLAAGGAALVTAGILGASGDDDESGVGHTVSGGLTIDCGLGTGDHPENCLPADFNTTEAQAQEGVLKMNSQYAYARGYDGRIFNRDGSGTLLDDQPDGNVLVAVIDSGVYMEHDDLDTNMRTDLAVTCTIANGCVAGGEDEDGHGTKVAGIIAAERNDVGMHGVAPGANIIPIAAIIDNGSTTAAFKHANDNGAQVINNSWSLIYDPDNDPETIPIVDATGPTIAVYHPTGDYDAFTPLQLRTLLTTVENGTSDLQEFSDAVAAGRIIVFSAGNSTLTQPGVMAGLPVYFQGATAPAGISQPDYDIVNPTHLDWSKHWVASVSLTDSDVLSSFSHQCGMAKNWCLATPGEIASTTQLNGGYATANGTSFSAPNVSGAIAVMLGAFPHLTPEEALEILFDTATDLGAPGVDDVYGRGLVNLNKATDPTVGGWTLSASFGGMGSQSYNFSNSGFALSSPFGNALGQNHVNLMFQDSYKKDYTVPLSVVAGNLVRRQTMYDRFNAFSGYNYDNVMRVSDYSKLGFSAADTGPVPDKTSNRPFGKFAFQSAVPLDKHAMALTNVNYRTNMADAMQDVEARNLVASDAMKNPYLNQVDSASSGIVGYQQGNTSVRVAAFSGTMNSDNSDDAQYMYRFGSDKSVSGAVGEVTVASADRRSAVAVQNGVSVEENSFLGSETSGAFGIDKSSTYFTGISARYGIARDIALLGSAHFGMTDVSAASSSIFTNFGSVFTNSFALGAEFNNVAAGGDTLGLVASQPLRVSRGAANLTLPTDVATGGSVVYRDQRLNLSPNAREFDIESYYHLMTGERSQLSFNAIYRINPDNDNTADNDITLLTKYKLGF